MAEGSANVEEVRQKVAGVEGQLSHCCPKMNQDLTNLMEGKRAMRRQPEPLPRRRQMELFRLH